MYQRADQRITFTMDESESGPVLCVLGVIALAASALLWLRERRRVEADNPYTPRFDGVDPNYAPVIVVAVAGVVLLLLGTILVAGRGRR